MPHPSQPGLAALRALHDKRDVHVLTGVKKHHLGAVVKKFLALVVQTA